jgi:cobalt/nickel transport system permease protein
MLAVILPLFYGQTILLQLGFLTVKLEGCVQLLLITGKFFSILVLGLVLFATATIQTNVMAMRAIGLPLILTDMALFSYRYLFEFAAMLRTLQIATRLRGFRENRLQGIRTYAHLAGTMLVRSYEQSDRVYKAMILRGYGSPQGEGRLTGEFALYSRNFPMLALFILLAAGFIIAQALYAAS